MPTWSRCSWPLRSRSWRPRDPRHLSVRRIAAAAGVAPMGVYNHFDSKNGIIEALFIQGFERLREALTTIAEIKDPYEALREAGRRYRALAQAHPMVYQLMFLRTLPGYEPSDRRPRGGGPSVRQPCGRRPTSHGGRRHRRRTVDRDGATHLGLDPRMGVTRAARHRNDRRRGLRIRPRLLHHVAGTPSGVVALTRIWTVQVPMAGHRRIPASLLLRPQRDHPESADRPLATFGVPIEQFDREGCGLRDRAGQPSVVPVAALPDGGVPETHIPGRNVEVTRSACETNRDRGAAYRCATPPSSPTNRSAPQCPIRRCAPRSPDR